MKILVIGKNGQLGKSIHKLVVNTKQIDNFVFVDREELDLSNGDSITLYFEKNVFDIIINCAAYTAVDKAEEEQDLANRVNHLAVKQLAQIAKNKKTKLIHISTDYVFDGESDRPYIETDKTNPLNTYGRTKLAGEQALKEIMPTNAIIIRASWLYSEYGNNFVKTMIRLGVKKDKISVVSDQMGSPTYAVDLARVILQILNNKNYQTQGQVTEIYHYSSEGEVSWYEFSKEIFKITQMDCQVAPVATEEYSTAANRPKNTVMSKKKIASVFNCTPLDWRESLSVFLLSEDIYLLSINL